MTVKPLTLGGRTRAINGVTSVALVHNGASSTDGNGDRGRRALNQNFRRYISHSRIVYRSELNMDFHRVGRVAKNLKNVHLPLANPPATPCNRHALESMVTGHLSCNCAVLFCLTSKNAETGSADPSQRGRRMPISIRSANLRGYYTIPYQLSHQEQAKPGICLYAV